VDALRTKLVRAPDSAGGSGVARVIPAQVDHAARIARVRDPRLRGQDRRVLRATVIRVEAGGQPRRGAVVAAVDRRTLTVPTTPVRPRGVETAVLVVPEQ